MKRFIVFFVCLYALAGIKAQVAKWLIPPSYDKIQMASGIDAVMTDSVDVKIIWTIDGKRLLSCKDVLYPFKEDIALAVKKGTPQIVCAYRQNGEIIPISGFNVTHKYPYYSCGKLLVQNGVFYQFIDADGVVRNEKYVKAYPYFNGYATCSTFLNMEKQKDYRNLLIDDRGSVVNFYYDGKQVNNDDIQYISSINDENKGVVVIKSKVFLFDGTNRELSPVYATENVDAKKKKEQVKLIGDFERSFVQNSDTTFLLCAKHGKTDMVSIVFDSMQRPSVISRNGKDYFYKQKEEQKKAYESNLRVRDEGNLIGLCRENGEEILPPQFEEVPMCIDERAMVKLNGKYGLLSIIDGVEFRLRMNKGDDIAFRHQKFETTIRADFPTSISADKVGLEIDPATGCDIDKTSKHYKNTESGNFVEYNCVLNIPKDLPDELTTIEYPVTIYYDGFKSSIIPFGVKAWHYKYFVVDVDDSQTALEKGTVSFVFNINADRIASDGVYPTAVEVFTDSLQIEYEKMSEIRHKCKVYSLKEGVNNIVIQITEQGCPPATFPFEVVYFKPVAKTRNKPAEEEKVTIKKKEKVAKPKENDSTGPRVIM